MEYKTVISIDIPKGYIVIAVQSLEDLKNMVENQYGQKYPVFKKKYKEEYYSFNEDVFYIYDEKYNKEIEVKNGSKRKENTKRRKKGKKKKDS